MAIVNIPAKELRLENADEITKYLGSINIDYERWQATRTLPDDASEAEILNAYSDEIEKLKNTGGYAAADVINVTPDTPGLSVMLDKFNKEHWHDEDEVRFVVKGHGLFHIAPSDGDVVSIEMGAGDLIRVPRGTLHWFDLCSDRTIRAIRLFQDPTGWTPHYTGSGTDSNFQPLCFAPTALGPDAEGTQ